MHKRCYSITLILLAVSLNYTWGQDLVAPVVKLEPTTKDKCLQVLREGMKSKDFWPSIHAAEGLTIAGKGAEVIEYLEPKLPEEKDDQKRCGLARELVRAGKREHVQVMLDILAGSADFGHVHAAESLYKVNEIGDGKAMKAAYLQTGSNKLSLMAAAALARKGDREKLDFIRAQLSSNNSEDSRTAAWILGRMGSYKDISELKELAEQTTEPLTKAYYQHSLAALGDPEGLKALKKNLRHTDGVVRTYAATFAGDANAVDCEEELIAMLDDRHEDAAIRAAQTLLFLSNGDRR